MNRPTKQEVLFSRVYDVLEQVCQASPRQRADFIYHFAQATQPPVEYRFQGLLGFGGKFWNNNGKFYVSCYAEHETPAVKEAVAAANELLMAIYRDYTALQNNASGGPDIWAVWPDGYMCPREEVEEVTRMGSMPLSDDYYLVDVREYDETGMPSRWERAD